MQRIKRKVVEQGCGAELEDYCGAKPPSLKGEQNSLGASCATRCLLGIPFLRCRGTMAGLATALCFGSILSNLCRFGNPNPCHRTESHLQAFHLRAFLMLQGLFSELATGTQLATSHLIVTHPGSAAHHTRRQDLLVLCMTSRSEVADVLQPDCVLQSHTARQMQHSMQPKPHTCFYAPSGNGPCEILSSAVSAG